MRRRLAESVREEVDRRKRAAAVMTYDDLLVRLDDALRGPGGDEVAARLRARYKVVLVDEFQDTDPVQWDIMRRAFGDGTLVLIGDPKQAIYAFRGADVYAYLAAARSAAARATLRVNWRSDQGLIDAYDALFGGARLGHEGIVYRQVRAAAANQAPRLSGAPVTAPLRVRVVHRDEPSIERTYRGFATAASAREHVADDLAGDVVSLLESGAELERRADDGSVLGHERVRPGHIAVLVRTHRTAALIRDALDVAGVPAVINGAGSVFGTAPAKEWLRLLEAIERPTATARARSAALTPFLGWTAERVACAGEDEWEAVHRRLHDWSRVLRARGVAALTETITLAEGLPGRVLATVEGERRLTDLRHVGELLHAAATAEQMGAAALTAWLRRRIAEAAEETADEERSRRLESDAEAVQVLTIHRSKGLEFPIAYFPYLWEPGYIPRDPQPVAFHDPDAGDRRTIDVALEGPDFAAHHDQHVIEQRGEDLRLAYVALTRARHQAIVWWAPSWECHHSPLGRLLFSKDADGTVAAAGARVPEDAAAVARFQALAAQAPGCVAVERSRLAPLSALGGRARRTRRARRRPLRPRPRPRLAAHVVLRPHGRRPRRPRGERAGGDGRHRRAGARHGTGVRGGGPRTLATPSRLGAMPVGVEVGTFVHRVLEATDFAAPDLHAELAARVAQVQARRQVDVGEPAAVVAGLAAAIETPLGPLAGGARLRDVARGDRLDELDFELPLLGGDDPTGRLRPAAIGAALRAHLPPDDPLAGYAARLDDQALRSSVRGYLTGSLDLVVRLPGPRFAIADYKTNWLAAPGEALSAWHHRPAALQTEMERAHYGLQALLYTVALHRYLRWRLPGYDPGAHLAGVLYLFLRGMTGPDTPVIDGTPCGVFAWRPSGALVEALSDVLDAGAAA